MTFIYFLSLVSITKKIHSATWYRDIYQSILFIQKSPRDNDCVQCPNKKYIIEDFGVNSMGKVKQYLYLYVENKHSLKSTFSRLKLTCRSKLIIGDWYLEHIILNSVYLEPPNWKIGIFHEQRYGTNLTRCVTNIFITRREQIFFNIG